ncbi:ABC transporter permease [Oceanobacillus sp. CFH 90083]|uniref:ABC transporter permease n=1 Tax=Oceanobacillus sp. CFH 90083 TaxID=2592336 RepID=UPI00128CE5B8|nr:ABC transporter permease [Oceanobacillus sp. CFH 90083]
MFSFLKKDLFVFWRDRKEVLIALFAPILLIYILNFAFADVNFDEPENMDVRAGVIIEDDQDAGFHQFQAHLESTNVSQQEQQYMLEKAEAVLPIELFLTFLNDDAFDSWLHVEALSESEAMQQMDNGELDAILKIPNGFTNDILLHTILNEPVYTPIHLQIEEDSMETTILSNVIDNFINGLNLHFAMDTLADGEMAELHLPEGGIEFLHASNEAYGMEQYFTVAMSTLFALFIAHTVATKTAAEKRQRVFNRILITNSRPLSFLFGKVAATFLFTWIQMMTVFLISHLILDIFPEISFTFWVRIILIIAFSALTIAGLSAVFTSMMLRFNNINLVSGMFMIIIMLLAVLGGNFFPIGEISNTMAAITGWTPNGITVNLYTQLVQFGESTSFIIPFLKQFGFFIVFLLIGILLFPERRQS